MKNILFSMILVTASSIVMATDWEAVDFELMMNGTPPEVNGDLGGWNGVPVDAEFIPFPFPDASHERSVFNEHEITDLQLIAESNGWTLEQAKKHRSSIRRIGHRAQMLAMTHPDTFIGAVAPDEWDGNPVLYFKGEVDTALLMTLNAADIDVVDNQPYSLRELKQKQQRVYSNLADQGYKHIVTSFDIREGVIEAVVTRTDDVVSPRSVFLDDVTITFEDEPVVVDHAAYGGMTAASNGSLICTTGWPVIYSIYPGFTINGVSTAGHCSGINQVSHPGETHNAYLMREYVGFWGDMEWHVSDEFVTANFYASENQIRPVQSIEPVGNIVVGEPICVYGRVSNHRDCSLRVKYTSVVCGGKSNLVLMNGRASTFGDSGGGWSWGTRAYGSNVGTCAGNSIFTPVDLFDEGMGVRVLTQ
ncbi:MAG: hypothetical protein V3U84_02075 [Thiotrichaceae bacterium]